MGISPKKYLVCKRTEGAYQRLRSTTKKIAYIALCDSKHCL